MQFKIPNLKSGWLALLLMVVLPAQAAPPIVTVQSAGSLGFNVYANGVLVAPIRLAAHGAIVATQITTNANGLVLSGLQTADPLAVTFATNDFVSITLATNTAAAATNPAIIWEPQVQFHLTIESFNTNHWLAMFPEGPAPFHFLTCTMPTAQVWHQLGWLDATPYADPFPLLEDVHTGTPEISCLWNRNWGYIVPLGGQAIPMLGLWDPTASLYVGYDFQGARASDQSERSIATAYCWGQGSQTNFITLAYPYGGPLFGNQVYPAGGEVLSSWFNLEIETNLPSTEDPNEQFQERLFARYTNSLPLVPAMNDLGWLPGLVHLTNFAGPIPFYIYSLDPDTTYYVTNTTILTGWRGEIEMPIDTAAESNDLYSIDIARQQVEIILTNFLQTFTVGGDTCMYWVQPLTGSWNTNYGGTAVATLHNSVAWYAARMMVELYRYDVARGQAQARYLTTIDGLFNWSKHFVWTRNEFQDVPSSPFSIGCTLSTSFLLDYYFTFRTDPQRSANAQLALHLADNIIYRYLQIWAMDSDRSDSALDGSFLAAGNSGRDWSGLASANEVTWIFDSITQVYVHTGDPRLRYYLRGMLQRWYELYQPNEAAAVADYDITAFTEGFGLFDGSGPGRGGRYNYGSCETLPANDPIGNSTVRVIAGANACIAFDRFDTTTDVTNYRNDTNGDCSFELVSGLSTPFDVSFSYPYVNISSNTVTLVRNGQTNVLTASNVTRPSQSPSSLYLSQMQAGDIITIGNLPPNEPIITFDTSLVYNPTNVQPFTNGTYQTLPLNGTYPLPQIWSNLNTFAGINPGLKWNCGVPYQQTPYAVTNTVAVTAPGASAVSVFYAPPPGQWPAPEPTLTLDDASTLPLSGNPALAWQAWPIIFTQTVLQDYAVLPPGRSLRQLNPNGTLIMAATGFTGDSNDWQTAQTAFTNAAVTLAQQEQQTLSEQALAASFALLPTGKIALLPLNTPGAAANFAHATGLDQKWDAITEQQLVNSNQFNAARYPLAFDLAGENYVATVNTPDDGQTALTQYLAGGGTLVLLTSGPTPLFYAWGPDDAPGPGDPVYSQYGIYVVGFEEPPVGIYMQRYTNQGILNSVPVIFPFPSGDPRLRAINGEALSTASRYIPMIETVYPDGVYGFYHGDAAAFMAFGSGPAAGGKILYVWDTLQIGTQGQAIMQDVVTWVVNATLRPPVPKFGPVLAPDKAHVVFNFNAVSNLFYEVQYRNSLATGAWSTVQTFTNSPVNQSLWVTNEISGTSSGFYRLIVGP